MTVALADLTWPEAERWGQGTLLVPVGATEQHGPHLPLSTDTDIALAICERCAPAIDGALLAAPVSYAASDEHRDFPGTVTIGCEPMESLLLGLCRSACATFARVVLVSTHGGNARPVARATRRLRREGHDVIAWSPSWHGDAHAGATETALMLAISPRRVLLPEAAAGNRTPLAELLPLLECEGVRAASESGVLGDPTAASAEHGRDLLEQATRDLIATLAQQAAQEPVR